MTIERDANSLLMHLAGRARRGLTLTALVTASACGAAEDPYEFETVGAPFKAADGGDAFEFITQLPQVVASNNRAGAFDPALCSRSGHVGYIFVRDRDDRVQTHTYSGANPNGWTRYGNANGQPSPKTFAGRLSCAATGFSGSKAKFILVGRGKADNLLYASAGTVNDAVTNAYSDASNAFSLVDASNTYSNSPAVASHDGHVVLTVVGNDGRLYAYYKNPNGNWSGRIQGPSISGWTLRGTPAVTYVEGPMQQYHIYVRATGTIQGVPTTRFQRAYFTVDRFTGPASIPTPSMAPVSLVMPHPSIVDSDPAVEWTGAAYEPNGLEYVLTLYYRSGAELYQTSGDYYPEEHPLELVTGPLVDPSFTGTPSVLGGVPYEVGQHWFVAQDTSNRIWFGSSHGDGVLIE